MSATRDLLVLRAAGLGDLLTVVPALRGLRRAHPQHRLLLATPAAFRDLVHDNSLADGVVALTGLRRLPSWVHGSALAVNLHGCGPASTRLLLATRPERLIAFANRAVPDGPGAPSWEPSEHEVHRWTRLLQHHGIPCDPADLHLRAPESAIIDVDRRTAVLHPGAKAPARRWPPRRWIELARLLQRDGLRVLLTGNRGETPLCAAIAREAGLADAAVLAGATSVSGLASVVSHAGVVVSGDTGVAHLATAYRTPSVVLFGPMSPRQWGPPPLARHRVLWCGRSGDVNEGQPDAALAAIDADSAHRAALDALSHHQLEVL